MRSPISTLVCSLGRSVGCRSGLGLCGLRGRSAVRQPTDLLVHWPDCLTCRSGHRMVGRRRFRTPCRVKACWVGRRTGRRPVRRLVRRTSRRRVCLQGGSLSRLSCHVQSGFGRALVCPVAIGSCPAPGRSGRIAVGRLESGRAAQPEAQEIRIRRARLGGLGPTGAPVTLLGAVEALVGRARSLSG